MTTFFSFSHIIHSYAHQESHVTFMLSTQHLGIWTVCWKKQEMCSYTSSQIYRQNMHLITCETNQLLDHSCCSTHLTEGSRNKLMLDDSDCWIQLNQRQSNTISVAFLQGGSRTVREHTVNRWMFVGTSRPQPCNKEALKAFNFQSSQWSYITAPLRPSHKPTSPSPSGSQRSAADVQMKCDLGTEM